MQFLLILSRHIAHSTNLKHFRVIDSKSKKFPVGKYVLGLFGWRTHTISSDTPVQRLGYPDPSLLPDFEGLPLSLGVGALGMPG